MVLCVEKLNRMNFNSLWLLRMMGSKPIFSATIVTYKGVMADVLEIMFITLTESAMGTESHPSLKTLS